MNLKELKQKSPTELLTQAEDLGIEDASSMRKQDLMFAILKNSPMTIKLSTAKAQLKSCRTVSVFSVPPNQTILPALMTYMFRLPRLKIWPAHRRYC